MFYHNNCQWFLSPLKKPMCMHVAGYTVPERQDQPLCRCRKLYCSVQIYRSIVYCLFVCGISLTSGQLVSELFPDCTRSCFSQVVSRRRGGDRIYEMRCLFVAVGPNARFIVLPHWDYMSQAHMLTHPVTLY